MWCKTGRWWKHIYSRKWRERKKKGIKWLWVPSSFVRWRPWRSGAIVLLNRTSIIPLISGGTFNTTTAAPPPQAPLLRISLQFFRILSIVWTTIFYHRSCGRRYLCVFERRHLGFLHILRVETIMGTVAGQVMMPVCESLCFFCPALRARSRHPIKRYKKLLSDIFPRSQVLYLFSLCQKYFGILSIAMIFWLGICVDLILILVELWPSCCIVSVF